MVDKPAAPVADNLNAPAAPDGAASDSAVTYAEDRRQSALDSVADARAKQLEEEMAEGQGDAPTPEAQDGADAAPTAAPADAGDPAAPEATGGEEIPAAAAGDGAAAGEEPAAPEAAGEGAPAADAADPDDPKIEVMVHGEKRQVLLSELRRKYQISEGAEASLQAANAALERAHQAEAVLQRAMHQGVPADGQQPAGAQPGPAADGEQPAVIDYGAVAKAVQYGTEDEAASALEGVFTNLQARAPAGADRPLTQADLDRNNDEQHWNAALGRFGTAYPEITADGNLSRLAGTVGRDILNQAVADSRSTGQPMPSYDDILHRTGEATRNWLKTIRGGEDPSPGDPAPTPTPTPTVEVSAEKTAAKRAADQPPVARARPARVPQSPQKNADAVIEDSRRQGIEDIVGQRNARFGQNQGVQSP
jgi:hypothetical protein